ncbi:MAG: glycine/sarcosine/betaine reductase selenoprotein B family protein [Actinomycetota bacterium]
MSVDSYRFLPRSLAAFFQAAPVARPGIIPFSPLSKPLADCSVALVTTAGLHLRDEQPPFDLDRERREPAWGDPSFREIPASVRQDQIGASHLHYNTADTLEDVNCVFPIHRLHEAQRAGRIGAVAPTHYSFMGFQLDQHEQVERYVPQVVQQLRRDAVDAALLTPA